MEQIKTKFLTSVYPPEDQLISDWLNGAGIEVFRKTKNISGFVIALGPLAEVKLYVRDDQFEEARELLAALALPEETEETL